MEPGVWIQLLKTVYGLADGTREWRDCFLAEAKKVGFKPSVLEPCLLTIAENTGKYNRCLGVTVDDVAGGGGKAWQEAMQKLRTRFRFGKWEKRAGKFCGREVRQMDDGSIEVGQPSYAKHIDFIPVASDRKHQDLEATDEEKSAMRSVLGALSS